MFVASMIVVDCFGLYFHSFLQPCQFCGPWGQSLVDHVCDMFPLPWFIVIFFATVVVIFFSCCLCTALIPESIAISNRCWACAFAVSLLVCVVVLGLAAVLCVPVSLHVAPKPTGCVGYHAHCAWFFMLLMPMAAYRCRVPARSRGRSFSIYFPKKKRE